LLLAGAGGWQTLRMRGVHIVFFPDDANRSLLTYRMYALNTVNTYDVCHFFYNSSIAILGDGCKKPRLEAQYQREF
jgi:hypothetical protein